LFWPETTGRHLEEVDQIFRDSKTIFDPPRVSKRLTVRPLADDDAFTEEKV